MVTAHEGRAQLAVLRDHTGNVGVFARAGLMDRRGAVGPGGGRGELGRRTVEVHQHG